MHPILVTGAAGVACFLFLLLMHAWQVPFVPLKLSGVSPGEVGTTLLGFLLLSLFVERAIEVYTNAWRDPGKRKLVRAVQLAQTSVASAESAPAARAVAVGELESTTSALDDFSAETAWKTSMAALLLGGAIALFGVHALEAFVPADSWACKAGSPAGNCVQRLMFSATDVLITAAIIGGGASGIHKIISVFTTHADATKARQQGTSTQPQQ